LEHDLAADYDYALHLGQAPGSAELRLEAIALNVGGPTEDASAPFKPLVSGGPVAYRSPLPLAQWAEMLRGAGIPAAVSFHAGTYLCNATLYLSHHLVEKHGWRTKCAFIHVPLDPGQAARETEVVPHLPVAMGARALSLIVGGLIKQEQVRGSELA
jgi:pyroglutamyl-peptidase